MKRTLIGIAAIYTGLHLHGFVLQHAYIFYWPSYIFFTVGVGILVKEYIDSYKKQ